jgi:hypothetical protein
MGCVLALMLLMATTSAAVPASGSLPPAGVFELVYADGRVTGDVQRVPRDEVIKVLGERAGVEFYGELRDNREVSARLDEVRFRDAVDRLVGDQNFAIVYDASGRPVRVELWGMPGSPKVARVSTSAQNQLANLVAGYPPVALPPLLAAAFRAPTARLPSLLRRGLRDGNPAIRAAAAAAFVRALDGVPYISAAIQRTDDQALRSLIRSWAGTGDKQVLGILASGASDPLVRSKARRVLEQIAPAQGRPHLR